MVQNYTQRAVFVLLVAKAFVDRGDGTILVGRLDPPHPHRNIALDKGGRGYVLRRAPAHNRETVVERVFVGVPAEIRQCACFGRAERLLAACHSRFEKDRPKVIAIVAVDIDGGDLAGGLYSAFFESLGDGNFTVAPSDQGLLDVVLGN